MSPNTLTVRLEGIGSWSPELPDWPALQAWLAGGPLPPRETPAKPTAAVLSATERRRAPFHVRMALDVAHQAMTMSGRDPATTPSLFVSAHGDTDILDYVCQTLATAPAELSPTRFHNSVHNAAAGYWTMATGCHAASSALTAHDYSFAAGLLEAASLAVADGSPALLVANDGPGKGPLAACIGSQQAFACALVLAPEAGQAGAARLALHLEATRAGSAADARWQRLHDTNLAARGLPLLAALAEASSTTLRLPAGPRLDLVITVGSA